MRILLLSCFFVLLLCATALSRPLVADTVRDPQPLAPYCDWLPDPEGRLGVESITSDAMQAKFMPLPGRMPLKASGPIWLRLNVIGQETAPGAVVPVGDHNRLLLNLGPLPPGKTTLFYSENASFSAADAIWRMEELEAHENFLLPEIGLGRLSVLIHMEETPGLWFHPLISAPDAQKPDVLPWALILPSLIIVALIACLLRAVAALAPWALCAALFLGCALAQTLLPLPALGRGFTLTHLPALLAPGMALVLLPQVGRLLFRSGSLLQDSLFHLCSLFGVALALGPLLPGMHWLVRLFPLWPLLLIPLLPQCLAGLASRRPGSLSFTGAVVLPILGAGLCLAALYHPDMHPLAMQGGLWGQAVGGLALALARTPRMEEALCGDEELDVDALDPELEMPSFALAQDPDFAGAPREAQAAPGLASAGLNAGMPPADKDALRVGWPYSENEKRKETYSEADPVFGEFMADASGHEAGREAGREIAPRSGQGMERETGREAVDPSAVASPVSALADSPEKRRAGADDADDPDVSPSPDDSGDSGDDESRAADEPRVLTLEDEDLSAYPLPFMETRQADPAGEILFYPPGNCVFNLHLLVREVHALVAPLAQSRGILFSWYVSPMLPSLLEGDAPRLRGALSLLLQSAVQATLQGTVQLAVRKTPGSMEPGDLFFNVSDSGAAQRADAGFFHAWELATRTGGVFTVEYSPSGGTQVGFSVRLALPADEGAAELLLANHQSDEIRASGVVRSLQEAESGPGQELRPAGEAGAENAETPDFSHLSHAAARPLPLAQPGVPPCIVIAEMTTSNRRLLASYLSGFVYMHLDAPHNADVPALVHAQAIALIIFDADSPERDIIRIIAALRKEESAGGLPPVPVMVLTGNEAQSARMLEAGSTLTLVKPFSSEALRHAVSMAAPMANALEAVPAPDADLEVPADSAPSEPEPEVSGPEPEVSGPEPEVSEQESEVSGLEPEAIAPETGPTSTGEAATDPGAAHRAAMRHMVENRIAAARKGLPATAGNAAGAAVAAAFASAKAAAEAAASAPRTAMPSLHLTDQLTIQAAAEAPRAGLVTETPPPATPLSPGQAGTASADPFLNPRLAFSRLPTRAADGPPSRPRTDSGPEVDLLAAALRDAPQPTGAPVRVELPPRQIDALLPPEQSEPKTTDQAQSPASDEAQDAGGSLLDFFLPGDQEKPQKPDTAQERGITSDTALRPASASASAPHLPLTPLLTPGPLPDSAQTPRPASLTTALGDRPQSVTSAYPAQSGAAPGDVASLPPLVPHQAAPPAQTTPGAPATAETWNGAQPSIPLRPSRELRSAPAPFPSEFSGGYMRNVADPARQQPGTVARPPAQVAFHGSAQGSAQPPAQKLSQPAAHMAPQPQARTTPESSAQVLSQAPTRMVSRPPAAFPAQAQAPVQAHAQPGAPFQTPALAVESATHGHEGGPFPQPPGLYPLIGIDGEYMDTGMLPLAPGLIYALGDSLNDLKQGVRDGQGLYVRESASRMAAKAETFGLAKLSRLARHIEQAAESEDLASADALITDLEPVLSQYIKAMRETFQAFLNLSR